MKNRIETDTLNEVYQGLRFVAERLEQVAHDFYQWKWIIIALDNSLQNSIVAAAADTSQTNILRNGKKVYKALRDRTDIPAERLDDFPKLLALAESDKMLRFSISKKLLLTDARRKSLDDLHRLRNTFIHFLPQIWLKSIKGFPEMAEHAICAIEFLLFESGNVIWQKKKLLARETCEAIAVARRRLAALTSTESLAP